MVDFCKLLEKKKSETRKMGSTNFYRNIRKILVRSRTAFNEFNGNYCCVVGKRKYYGGIWKEFFIMNKWKLNSLLLHKNTVSNCLVWMMEKKDFFLNNDTNWWSLPKLIMFSLMLLTWPIKMLLSCTSSMFIILQTL